MKRSNTIYSNDDNFTSEPDEIEIKVKTIWRFGDS